VGTLPAIEVVVGLLLSSVARQFCCTVFHYRQTWTKCHLKVRINSSDDGLEKELGTLRPEVTFPDFYVQKAQDTVRFVADPVFVTPKSANPLLKTVADVGKGMVVAREVIKVPIGYDPNAVGDRRSCLNVFGS
jgi:hypothetical protein